MVEDDGVNRGGVESDGAREGVTGEGSAEEEPVQINNMTLLVFKLEKQLLVLNCLIAR